MREEAAKAAAAEAADPWRLTLERVRGKVDYDGLERVRRTVQCRIWGRYSWDQPPKRA